MTVNKVFKPVPFRTHVQIALLPDQENRVEDFATNKDKLWDYVMGLVDCGCSITVRPNDRGGFAASCQAIHPDHKSAGLAIYSNAPTPEEAIAVLVFKLENVGPKLDWSLKAEQNTERKYR